MKFKKCVISLVISASLLMNTLGVYAGTMSIDQAWNQLSSSQQAKFGQVGIDENSLQKIDSIAGNTDLSIFISPPLSYENDRFTVSQADAEQVLYLLSIAADKEFDSGSMMGVFNDVVVDINSNSSKKTKQDLAMLLGQYGLATTNGGGEQLPTDGAGGGGGPLVQEDIQEKLKEKLDTLKEVEKRSKQQEVNLQKMIEVLSAQPIDPLASITTETVQKTWDQSIKWQENNANGVVFAKANAPVARWNISGNEAVTIPQGLWDNVSPYGRLELGAGSIVLSIEKNTYTNSTSKITVKPISKEGYKQAVTISTTAKIYSPAKISFFVDDEIPEAYGVYKLEDNKEILIGGIYNEAMGTVEALVKSSGTYAIKKTTPKTYNDLADVDWAKNQINHLGQKGYIAGKSEGVYGPKDDITRAEFAVLLTRILQLPSASISNKFKDMKTEAWYYSDVMATVEAKLFNGKSVNNFDPSGKITRQEVAAVISRILVQRGYSEPKVENVEKGIWAAGALALLKDQSLEADIPGFNDQVGTNANRAEVAYILYNLLQK